MATWIKSYTELSRLSTFEERFRYLRIENGHVGVDTFGSARLLNQRFYTSTEWRNLRNHLIQRDLGCDLGVPGHEIFDKIVVHHINPLGIEDFRDNRRALVDPENLICTIDATHKAIHYGVTDVAPGIKIVERIPNDTCPWRL